ncbi:MAG TPA: cytochrome c biogenesis protein CcdA [Thermodesulfovibrionia bacterium]|nr:cytochrome c biogenesis protein CcdA [Thermodesulfovibrionia bacterium]
MVEVSYPGAFLAGVISFLSPCVLPLLPSYVSFITGLSFKEIKSGDRKRVRKLTIINSLLFIAGFSLVFISMGASLSFLGGLFSHYQNVIRIVGGILVIIFGFFVMDIVHIRFLYRDFKLHPMRHPAGYFGSFLIGMTFAAGWTPCIGPILGTILITAAQEGTALYGVKLLLLYSTGLALPFFVSALAINSFLSHINVLYRYMRFIKIFSGLLLIGFGVMLVTNSISSVSGLLPGL